MAWVFEERRDDGWWKRERVKGGSGGLRKVGNHQTVVVVETTF